jgi:hypothetical protein
MTDADLLAKARARRDTRASHRSSAWRDLAPCQLRIEHAQFLNSGGFRAAFFAVRAVIPVTALRGACF